MNTSMTSRDDAGAARSSRAAFRHLLPRLLFGTWLAAVGILFTLDNVGLVDADDWLRYWPVLLVALGAGLLISAASPGELVWGILWMVVGGGMLLDRLDILPVEVGDFWPLALVVVGVLLVLRGVRPRAPAADDSSTAHAFAMLSGVSRKVGSVAFAGGSATAVMGGVELDLRGATMVRDQVAVDCFAMWGGIEITVPPDWTVVSRVWPFMGGFEDQTTPPAPEDQTGVLVVTGSAVMGGITVSNGKR